jgi:predicted tellurium resistance membrane protein TerC
MELLTDPQAWIAFVTLTALELVLGIDNIVFISILVDRLPPEKRDFTRRLGLGLAMFMRIALLLALAWLVGLTAPWFTILGEEFSGRDVILIAGGVFLIWKATSEIHGLIEGEDHHGERRMAASFAGILAQIAVIDLVFSLDSIITAVGMVDDIPVMIAAVVTAVLLMMVAAGPIGRFVSRHPTVKMLALSFLIMIGMALVADGFEFHVPKGYIYFAMAFSVAVEMLNLRMRSNRGVTKK